MRRHGWGIKSIKYTADRYDGATYINADNNRFDVKIAIPKKLTVYRLYEKENTQDESCVFSYFEKIFGLFALLFGFGFNIALNNQRDVFSIANSSYRNNAHPTQFAYSPFANTAILSVSAVKRISTDSSGGIFLVPRGAFGKSKKSNKSAKNRARILILVIPFIKLCLFLLFF